jgi:hypothetical protein
VRAETGITLPEWVDEEAYDTLQHREARLSEGQAIQIS